jgi:hypothetical protein
MIDLPASINSVPHATPMDAGMDPIERQGMKPRKTNSIGRRKKSA